jgi:hypothetical protein
MEIFHSPLTILFASINSLRVELFIEQIASPLVVYGLV